MYYKHVDVFSKNQLSGNSLTVFMLSEIFSSETMQKITQEMRHFESIFLLPHDNNTDEYFTYIFTLEEELYFAGHPLIGAACAIHDEYHKTNPQAKIKFNLKNRSIEIDSINHGGYYSAVMNQGAPEFLCNVPKSMMDIFLSECNLTSNDLYADLPLEVISTGLPYLIVPLKSGLERVRHKNITDLLSAINAKFIYFYDINKREGRTWDNDGLVEDVATGSAAGPVGAYLIKHGLAKNDESIIIYQGSFVHRPSEIRVIVNAHNGEVLVIGDVCVVGSGNLISTSLCI